MKKLLLALMTLLATSTIAMADQVELNFVDWGFDGASSWGSSYDSHTVVFDAATVVFDAANKQPSGNSIDDCPVTKGQPITVTLNDMSNDITAITFNLKQWGVKKTNCNTALQHRRLLFQRSRSVERQFYSYR